MVVIPLGFEAQAKTTAVGGPRGGACPRVSRKLDLGDAVKKIKGRKCHIVTDTDGNLVGLQVHAADIQDRDGSVDVLASIGSLYPWLLHVFADGGYGGDKLRDAMVPLGPWTLEIIRRSDIAKGFELLPPAGWSSAPLSGSTGAVGSPRTSKTPSQAPWAKVGRSPAVGGRSAACGGKRRPWRGTAWRHPGWGPQWLVCGATFGDRGRL